MTLQTRVEQSESEPPSEPPPIHIRFAPDILRRLGEELNPSPDQGILELVKNAYDANARNCRIELTNTDHPGGSVRVTDNGDGMTADEVANRWLVLGRSSKSASQKTRLGRIPAGNKGLGRLAALRMGTSAVLATVPRADRQHEFTLNINWDDFDDVELIDDVSLTITTAPSPPATKSGTNILLSDLRDRISRMDVKRLARALILLADPFGDNPDGFKPILDVPEFKDLATLVEKRYFHEAEYHLIAKVDKNGFATASIKDWRGEVLFEGTHGDIAVDRDDRPYESPEATFELWVFLLDGVTFSTRKASLSEVRAWLQEFGGVHLYQNGLRVAPYGNAGNDWLDVNLRRTQSPEERPSTTTIIGRVRVQDSREMLVQKTDRSGFIETHAFQELRSFARDCLEWMARRRLAVAEERRGRERAAAPIKVRKSRKALNKVINDLPMTARKEVTTAVENYERSHQKEVKQLRKEIQLYRTLSTAGITAATFAHESNGNPIKVINQSIQAIERRSRKLIPDDYDRELSKPVASIVKASESLAVLGTATLNLVDHEKRRPSKVAVHEVMRSVLKTFQPFLDGRDVTVSVELCQGNPYLHGSEAAVESIVTNLINNSLAAFEQARVSARQLQLRTAVQDRLLTLRVLDNGPGIEGIKKSDIWLPGQTTRSNGTGLGLTIVRDAVKDLGGDVDAVEHGELGGAEIVVELPILGI